MYEECNGAEKYYFYDSNGVISGIRYFDANGTMTMIYVVTNALGDVIALYDRNGNAVVEYQYDAWGNIISVVNSTEGSSLDWNEINPFRYRGYYYDSETDLYYLQSRYYDAETGRFLNSDVLLDTSDILGFNPFAYCLNNPILYVDYSGALCAIHAGGGGMPTNNNSSNNMLDTATAAYIQRTNMEIDMYYTQYEMIKEVMEYCFYINLQATLYQSQQATAQAELAGDFIANRFSTPEKASNTLSAIGWTLDVAAAYCGGVAAGLSIPTLGMSIPTAGTTAAILTIASLPFHGVALAIDIFTEE